MTVRMAHPTHKWNYQTGDCRQCGIPAASKSSTLPCAKAPVVEVAPKAPSTKQPNIHAASLIGAKGLRSDE